MKGAHGAVVVAGDAVDAGVELGRDVAVQPARRQGGAGAVVELEDGQEGLLVAHVGDAGLVEVVEAAHELARPPISATSPPMSWGTKKEYSHGLPSYVS